MKRAIDELRVEERKERKERYSKEKQFILLLLLFFSYFSNRSRPSGDQTLPFSGPGQFLVATGDRATAKFYPCSCCAHLNVIKCDEATHASIGLFSRQTNTLSVPHALRTYINIL